MTSAAIKPDSGAGGPHAEGRGYGLVLFAAVLQLLAAAGALAANSWPAGPR